MPSVSCFLKGRKETLPKLRQSEHCLGEGQGRTSEVQVQKTALHTEEVEGALLRLEQKRVALV